MLHNLLLDLDGTLIDSSPSILSAYHAALELEGVTPAVPLSPSLIGPPLREALSRLAGRDDPGLIERLASRFRHAYDTCGYRSTQVYPGIPAALRDLCSAGADLFVVTNKRAVPTSKIISFFGWGQYFQGIYSLDTLRPPAQSKTVLVRHVLRGHDLVRNGTCLVGDTSADADAAADNGIAFAGVQWGYGSLDKAGYNWRCVLEEPRQLATLLSD